MQQSNGLAVVTGANRGLGFEASRQLAKLNYEVILTSRHADTGKRAASLLVSEGLNVSYFPLDVADRDNVEELSKFTASRGGAYILVNNAGIMPDGAGSSTSAFNTDLATLRNALETNSLGPYTLCQSLLPQMQSAGRGRIVNVSSGMGQLGEMGSGYPAYRISKTALNAVTRIFSQEVSGQDILINSICPGWVKTDMGGSNATRTVIEGVDTIVWAATLPTGGPSGGFFRDRKAIVW